MKNSKKAIALALALTSAFSIAGCGKKEENTLTKNSKTDWTISEEPVELTVYWPGNIGIEKFLEETDNWKEIAKITNVSLKTVNSKNVSDWNQAFSTMLASGNLPDLVAHADGRAKLSEYGMQGAFMKINELAEKYNCENIKEKVLDDKKVMSYASAPDLNLYYAPKLGPETNVAAGWMIRQDWLDKLGLQAPTTIEEFYNVLVAFRDGDPNGNGKKDEIPFFSRMSQPYDLLALWDACLSFNADENNKVYYGPTRPEFKEAMLNLAKWYGEGLIDKEIFTRGWKSRDNLLGENLGGMTHDWFGSTAQFNDVLKDTVPGLKLVAFAPVSGKEYSSRPHTNTSGVGISSTTKKEEVAIKFLDFFYNRKGQLADNFGTEGVTYDMNEENIPIFKDHVLHGDKGTINILQEHGAQIDPWCGKQDYWYEEQWINEEARAGVNMYMDNGYIQEPYPTFMYSKEDNDRMTELKTSLDTHIWETAQKWFFGAEDIEANYDAFITTLNKMGLQEMLEIEQKYYDNYVKEVN